MLILQPTPTGPAVAIPPAIEAEGAEAISAFYAAALATPEAHAAHVAGLTDALAASEAALAALPADHRTRGEAERRVTLQRAALAALTGDTPDAAEPELSTLPAADDADGTSEEA